MSCHWCDDVKEYDRAIDNTVRRMRIESYMSKATDTFNICNKNLLLLHGHSGYANAPERFVLRVLLVLL